MHGIALTIPAARARNIIVGTIATTFALPAVHCGQTTLCKALGPVRYGVEIAVNAPSRHIFSVKRPKLYKLEINPNPKR